jgi:hypothetical protein
MMTDFIFRKLRAAWCAAALFGAVAGASLAARAADTAPLHASSSPRLVQAGERLLLLGVTSDNHALVQEGTQVYATELRPHARKQLVATSPPGIVAFVYTVGPVAFVWTTPNRSIPGFGVSPLTVWSAATGARLASDNSPIGTFTTSASADGRHVMYPARGTADGSVGDIEFARTDLSHRETLVAGVPMAFPAGACRPWGSFVGKGSRSYPVALFCEGGAATGTLARWSSRGDERATLLSGVLLRPFFTVSPDGTRFFTALADGRVPVVVNNRGEVQRLEEGVLSRLGFFTSNDDVIYSALTVLGVPGEIHRAGLRSGSTSFVAGQLAGFHIFQFGSDLIVTPYSSPDGRKLAYFGGVDPVSGLRDVLLADLVNSGSTALETERRHTLLGSVFSSDSRYTTYARVDDPSTGNAQLIASGPKGRVTIGAPSLVSNLSLRGSRIAFNDNPVADPSNSLLSTADLKVVDLSRPSETLRLVQAQAYQTFLSARHGRDLVFTSPSGPAGAGLYVQPVRQMHASDDD